MRRLTSRKTLGFLLLYGVILRPLEATKFPSYYWDVQGAVRDWRTKKPVQGAQALVFLDGAAMHQGWNAEQGDYPDLPQTSAKGAFFATATLWRTTLKERPDVIEAVVMAPGYMTARFKFAASEVSGGAIIISPELFNLTI